jgi:hypothetical protein
VNKEIIWNTLTAPEKEVHTEVENATDFLNESHVYVHCHLPHVEPGMLVRIWKTTFLRDLDSPGKSELVHAENISYAPQWTMIGDSSSFSFLLIFSALPKSCTRFDLVEEIAQPGGFHVSNIQRNKTDVYNVMLSD